MKAFKMFIVAAIVIALLVVIFSLMGGGGSSTPLTPAMPELIVLLRSRVDKDWDNAQEWNQKTYEKELSKINTQKKDLEKQAAGSYKAIMDYTNNKVCSKLISFVNQEFALTNCSSEKINELKSAMDLVVSKDRQLLTSLPEVKETYAKITLYNDILRFGKASVGLQPQFKFYTGTWNDFDTYNNQLLLKRSNFKKDKNFPALSHISEVNSSLNSLDEKLVTAKRNFQNNLSKEIIAAYQNVERTPANQQELQNVYNKFYGKEYNDERRLSEFRTRFIQEVKDNQQ